MLSDVRKASLERLANKYSSPEALTNQVQRRSDREARQYIIKCVESRIDIDLLWNGECFIAAQDYFDDNLSDNLQEDNHMNNYRTSDDFDVVTLLQMQNGAYLYKCRFDNSRRAYTYKSRWKFEAGEFAVVRPEAKNYGVIVEIIEPVDTIEPGIAYKWIIGKADLSEANEIFNIDNNVRKSLAMSRAMKEAEELKARIEGINVMKTTIADQSDNDE